MSLQETKVAQARLPWTHRPVYEVIDKLLRLGRKWVRHLHTHNTLITRCLDHLSAAAALDVSSSLEESWDSSSQPVCVCLGKRSPSIQASHEGKPRKQATIACSMAWQRCIGNERDQWAALEGITFTPVRTTSASARAPRAQLGFFDAA